MKTKLILLLTILLLIIPALLVSAGSLTPRSYLPLINRDKTPTPSPTPTNTKTPTPTPTNTPVPTATFTPTPSPTLTATNPPPIIDINILSVQPTGAEYVEIRNDGNTPINLQNWTLSDQSSHVFTFPAYTIQPGQTCRIYTDEFHPEWCGFNYNSGSPIWNNDGDCAYLRLPNNTLHAQLCY